MHRFILSLLSLVLVIAAGCSTTKPTTPKTQLEIREFQTRTYTTKDVKLVMKALFNVLQDDGFIVKNVSTDLGLLSATKEVHVEGALEASAALPVLGHNPKWKRNCVIDGTVNVTEFGGDCKVRVSFQAKLLSKSGKLKNVQSVNDINYYQRFFSLVDKGIFLQAEKL